MKAPNNKFYHLCSPQNVIQKIKSRSMRWAEHAARMGRGEVHTVLVHRIILKWILKKVD
jgi:hypothetical protein